MWTVVHIVYNEADVYKIKEILEKEGFLVKTRAISKEDGVYEILVLNAEAEEAHEILTYL